MQNPADSSPARHPTDPAATACPSPSSPRAIGGLGNLVLPELEAARTRFADDDVKMRILNKIRTFRGLADSPANLAWLLCLVRDTVEGKFQTFGEFAVKAGTMRNLDEEVQRTASILEQELDEAARPKPASGRTTNGARIPA